MKTTQKQLESFKNHCLYYQRVLGLNEWEMRFKLDKIKKAYADTDCERNYVAKIRLTDNLNGWNKIEDTEQFLKETALHEMVHVLTSRLYYYGWQRFISHEEMQEAQEEIATRLTNVLKDKL